MNKIVAFFTLLLKSFLISLTILSIFLGLSALMMRTFYLVLMDPVVLIKTISSQTHKL